MIALFSQLQKKFNAFFYPHKELEKQLQPIINNDTNRSTLPLITFIEGLEKEKDSWFNRGQKKQLELLLSKHRNSYGALIQGLHGIINTPFMFTSIQKRIQTFLSTQCHTEPTQKGLVVSRPLDPLMKKTQPETYDLEKIKRETEECKQRIEKTKQQNAKLRQLIGQTQTKNAQLEAASGRADQRLTESAALLAIQAAQYPEYNSISSGP